jgi:opacity protein-like surface antigen
MSDRMYWQVYEQLRYQYSPQTVLITEYRYGQTLTDSIASESTDQYFLIGADHRFSPNTIGTVRTGAQLRDVDGGSSATSPYLEFALNSQINPQLRVGAFMRYGMEGDDTVLTPDRYDESFNYDERNTFRLGVTGGYMISPDLSLNSGIDVIQSNYDAGRWVRSGDSGTSAPSLSETTFNAYIGMSVKLTDFLYGNLSYNYSQVVSDVNDYREYDRNRVSVGVSAEF